jgi:hypothetical protein
VSENSLQIGSVIPAFNVNNCHHYNQDLDDLSTAHGYKDVCLRNMPGNY